MLDSRSHNNSTDEITSSLGSFAAWELLKTLGAPEFGLIAQAVLAAFFKSLGAKVESVKQQNHPDIELEYKNLYWRIEVEFVSAHKSSFEVKKEDVEATKPYSDSDIGYVGFLDCNFPVHWVLISTKSLIQEGLGVYKLSKLLSISDKEISRKSTDWSLKFFVDHKGEIISKRFPGICSDYVFVDI